MRELVPGVEVFDNSFPRFQEVIDQAERSPVWTEGRSGGGIIPDIRRADVHELDRESELHQALIKNYVGALGEYMKKYTGVAVREIDFLRVARYEVGGHYAAHIDASGEDGWRRIVSSVLYLNDGYEGGELYFPLFDLTYKPVAGSLILFPSSYSYEHGSRPITKGKKYCVLSWYKQ